MTATEVFTLGLTNAVLATVLAACGWLLTRVWKNPHVASVVWLVVLLKLVTPPIVTLPIEWSEQTVRTGDAGSDVAKVEQETNALTFEPIAVESSFENDPFAEGSNAQMQLGAEFEQATDGAAGYPLTPGPSPEGEGSEFVRKAVPMGEVASPQVEDATSTVEAGTLLPVVVEDQVPGLSPVVDSKTETQTRAWPPVRVYELVAPVLLAVWLIGGLVVGGVTVRQAFAFRKLLRVAAVTDEGAAAVAGDVAGRMGLRRRPDVRSVSSNVGPLVWAGGIRPTIVVPRPLWDSIGEAEREILLAHELAHVARRDHWVRRVEAVVLALYWWLPTAWLAVRRREVAAELCCDALVLKTYPDRPRAYAEVLFHAVSQFSASRPVVLASGLGRISELKERLAMIVHDRIPKRPRMLTRLGLLVLGGAALFVSAQFVKADPQEGAEALAPVEAMADVDPAAEGGSDAVIETTNDAAADPFGSATTPPSFDEANPFGSRGSRPSYAQSTRRMLSTDPFGEPTEKDDSPSSGSFKPDEILFFSAEWDVRGQQVVKPVIEKLRKEGLRFQEIDIDKDAATARGYGVTSVPTFIAVKRLLKEDRKTEVKIGLDRLIGVQTEQALRELATRQVPYKSGAGRDKTLESLRKIIASKNEPVEVKVQAIRSYGRLARGLDDEKANAEKVMMEVINGAKEDRVTLAAAESLHLLGSPKGVEVMWSLLGSSQDVETLRGIVFTLNKTKEVPPTVESVIALATQQAAGVIEGSSGMGGGFFVGRNYAGDLLKRLGESADGIRRLVKAIETIKVDGGMEGGFEVGMPSGPGGGYGAAGMGMEGRMDGMVAPNPREALLAILREVKPETDEITDALVEALSSKDAGVRAAAAQALGNPAEPKEANSPFSSSPIQQIARAAMRGASGMRPPGAFGGDRAAPAASPARADEASAGEAEAPVDQAPKEAIRKQAFAHATAIKTLRYSFEVQDDKGWHTNGRVLVREIRGRGHTFPVPQTLMYSWLRLPGDDGFRWDSIYSDERWQEQFNKAIYIGRVLEEGHELEVIDFPQREGVQTPCLFRVYFAPDLGYLPIKYVRRVEATSEPSSTMEVKQFKTFDIDGKQVAVPTELSFEETGADGASPKQSLTFTVDEDSLKVNEDFTPKPGDADYQEILNRRAPAAEAPIAQPAVSDKVRAELIKSLSAAAQDEKASPESRAAALESFAKIAQGTESAAEVSAIAKRVLEQASDASEKAAAAATLQRLGDPQGIEALWQALAMSKPEERQSIIERLAAIEMPVPATAEGVVALAWNVANLESELEKEGSGPNYQSAKSTQLFSLQQVGNDVLKRIHRSGQGVNASVAAIESLKAESLAAGTTEEDKEIERRAKARLLALLKITEPTNDEIATALAEALSSKVGEVRKAAAEALGNVAGADEANKRGAAR